MNNLNLYAQEGLGELNLQAFGKLGKEIPPVIVTFSIRQMKWVRSYWTNLKLQFKIRDAAYKNRMQKIQTVCNILKLMNIYAACLTISQSQIVVVVPWQGPQSVHLQITPCCSNCDTHADSC